MARMTVLGGTGYSGAAVVAEAARRGHEVRAYSRTAPPEPVEGVTYETASVLDADVRRAGVEGSDVVFVALSPRGDMEGRVEGVVDDYVRLADDAGVRLGVLGGASSLLVAEGGQRVLEAFPPPAEVRSEIETGIALLEALRQAPASLDWFYLSPPLEYGAWSPAPATGSYRTSGDVLLTGPDGRSTISAADLAVAVVDEVERPQHRRQRFHVAL
jgi:putative NADH-flavin reductase